MALRIPLPHRLKRVESEANVEHCATSGGSVFRNVDVRPAKDKADLATVYLLVPTPTEVRGYTRASVMPISPADVEKLAARGAQSQLRSESLGYVYTEVTVESFSEDFDAGALVRLLPDWDLGNIEAHALFFSGRAAKPATGPEPTDPLCSL